MPAGGSRQHGWQPCIRYGGSGGSWACPDQPLPGQDQSHFCISGHLAGCQAPLRVSGPVSAHGLARRLEQRSLLCTRTGAQAHVLGSTSIGRNRHVAYLVQYLHHLLTL